MRGANTFIGSYYIAALRASAALAVLMGEASLSAEYAARAELAAKSYDAICYEL